MDFQTLQDGLTGLGFTSGFAIGGDPAEIILWENEEPQPSETDIVGAAPQGTYLREIVYVEEARRQAYQRDADPLFFGFQRGDNTEQEWLDAVAKVKADNPYPEVTK